MQHQLCVSGRKGDEEGPDQGEDNPQVLDEVIKAIKYKLQADPNLHCITIAPNDGLGHCACEPCLSKDKGDRNIADRMFKYFFNKIAKRVANDAEIKSAYPNFAG
jgi:hypothetical protein